jgi:AcrR family transcriptional regulator
MLSMSGTVAGVTGAPVASRLERKERTRQAILDAALRLAGEGSLATVSLRQVTREVGLVPTAFYRHFGSLDDVGLQLVDESLASLRAMLRDVRRSDPAYRDVIDRSVDVLVDHVHRQRAHFGFIARERTAGPPPVREAIRHGIELFERELATDIARLPGTETWSAEDLRVLSNLIVTSMVATAEQMVAASGRRGAEEQVVATARTQLRMVLVGALQWESRSR